MTAEESDTGIEDSLEDHELAVKRALESLGSVEDRFAELASDASADKQRELEPLGRALEQHVRRLEDLVRTLDDHKRAVSEGSSSGSEALKSAIERSRRRAKQEPTPPDSQRNDEAGDS